MINETTKQLLGIVKKSDVEDGDSQTPALEIITGTQALRDTLTLMKRSKSFFKLVEKPNNYTQSLNFGVSYFSNQLVKIKLILKEKNMIKLSIFKHISLIQISLLHLWIMMKKKQFLIYL